MCGCMGFTGGNVDDDEEEDVVVGGDDVSSSSSSLLEPLCASFSDTSSSEDAGVRVPSESLSEEEGEGDDGGERVLLC